MNKLHKILLRHCSPKDSVEVTILYVIASNEESILSRLDSSYVHGIWKDRDADSEIGTETYLEKMFRVRGEFNDIDASYDDSYYGISHWGWDPGVLISDADIDVLIRLGIAEDWRKDEV